MGKEEMGDDSGFDSAKGREAQDLTSRVLADER